MVKTSDRAQSSRCNTGFPNPYLSDRFHTCFSFARIFETVRLTSSVRHQQSPSKLFVLCDHCPQHSGHLVCQCDGREHAWLAGQNSPQPRAFRRWPNLGPGNHRHCANYQQAPDVALTRLARASKPLLAAAGMLSWNETQPSRKITSLAESLHWWSKSRQCHRGNGADPRHLLHASRKTRSAAICASSWAIRRDRSST